MSVTLIFFTILVLMPIQSSIYNVCLGQVFAWLPENWKFKILSNVEIGKKGMTKSFTHTLVSVSSSLLPKTLRDCRWLPRKHLIGCGGVKLFLTKDFCQKFFFCLECEFLSFVIIWVVEFCHNLSCLILSYFEFCQIELNFVPIQVFQFCHNFSFRFLLQF